MEDFSALKCTTIAELFYVIISYHIYTNVYNGKWSNSYQLFATYIQKLLKKYYNNGPLNAWHYDPFFLFSTYKVWLRQLLISDYIIYIYIYIYKESY